MGSFFEHLSDEPHLGQAAYETSIGVEWRRLALEFEERPARTDNWSPWLHYNWRTGNLLSGTVMLSVGTD